MNVQKPCHNVAQRGVFYDGRCTFAWETDMKLPAFGTILAISAVVSVIDPALAFQSSHTAIHVGGGYKSSATLGAPLYAGPNVIVIGGGRTFYGSDKYGRTHRRGGIDQRHGPRPGYGRGYGHGYDQRAPNYGYGGYSVYPYNLYRTNPFRFGNRYPSPGPGVTPRRGGRNYDDNRRYGRERYDRGPRLTILGATYRSIDGRACSAFSHVHKRCHGEQSCSVRASNSICGDPDRGRLKVLEVAYTCGGQQMRANVPEKSRSRLSCR